MGTAFGWWLDKTLGTSPWLFFLFFAFGVAAGVLNVYRTLSKYTRSMPPGQVPDGARRRTGPPARRAHRARLLRGRGPGGLGVAGGRTDVAVGVLGGGVLVGASYLAIRGAVDGLVGLLAGPATGAPSGGSRTRPGAKQDGPGPRSGPESSCA